MDEYIAAFKNKKHRIKTTEKKFNINFNIIITRICLAIIFFLVSIIFTNTSDKNLLLYKEHVLTNSMPFTKIKGWYEDMFGKVLPDNDNTQTVFNGKMVYKSIDNYLDGEALVVGANSLVNSIASGIVVYNGEKEGYGNTVIVQGVDGVDVWYGNITNVSVKLYDYIENGSVLGEVIDDKLYLVIKKDNNFIKYEDYQN